MTRRNSAAIANTNAVKRVLKKEPVLRLDIEYFPDPAIRVYHLDTTLTGLDEPLELEFHGGSVVPRPKSRSAVLFLNGSEVPPHISRLATDLFKIQGVESRTLIGNRTIKITQCLSANRDEVDDAVVNAVGSAFEMEVVVAAFKAPPAPQTDAPGWSSSPLGLD